MPTLAQILFLAESLTPQQRNTLMLALGILFLIVVVGGVALLIFRRHITEAGGGQRSEPSADVGFSLSELRKMRDRGEITPEEYEKTRARVVAKVKSSLGASPPVDAAPPPPPAPPGQADPPSLPEEPPAPPQSG